MRLSIFHSTSRALREFFLVLVQGYERAPRVSQLPIYNTLNCISGLVDMNRKEECHHALTALADIERMSLKGKPFSTIEEALYYVKEYTYIQKLRFGDNLSIY